MSLTDDELRRQLVRAKRLRVALARETVDAFNAYVLRDNLTHKRIQQALVHRAMNAAMDQHDRVVVWGFVESGKTVQLSGRILHTLGRDPSTRIAVVSKTAGGSTKILKVARELIEQRPEVREVFPGLRPGNPWRENAINLFGRMPDDKDYSVSAFGLHGNVLGSRYDLIIADDVVTFENSNTPKNRDDVFDWFFNTLMGRLTERGRVIVTGNAYHPEDFMHRSAKLPGWRGFKFPVLKDGASTWPERWSLERIERKRRENATEFARTMLCQPRSEEDARFPRANLEAAAVMGRGRPMVKHRSRWRPELPRVQRDLCRFYTGVDLAVQTHNKADFTALFTIALHPDNIREVVDVQIGRWQADEIVRRIVMTHRAWDSIVSIENVAGQDWIRQIAVKFGGVPVVPFTTGQGKANLVFQAEALSAEIAGGLWCIPSIDSGVYPAGVREWMEALLYYDPKAHTPDVMAASLFAAHRARLAGPYSGSNAVRALGEGVVGAVDRAAAFGGVAVGTGYDGGDRSGCWG